MVGMGRQGRAEGRHVSAALDEMSRPQGAAARVLGAVANAMTDVTGFGLAGHAQALARASGVDVLLRVADLPLYDGARALSEAGVASSLLPANQADAPVMGSDDALLHDPQTAGGLLAAVAAEEAEALLAALEKLGAPGYAIGRVVAGSGRVRAE